MCTFTVDEPHLATCTLTYEEPSRPEGPAWLRMKFINVYPLYSSSSSCVAANVTVIGTYFYDALTNATGVYAFYGVAPEAEGRGAKGREGG